MYYIYILYSESADLYYVGYSDDPHRRLVEHNNKAIYSFTAKHRPWIIKAIFSCGDSEGEAIKLERFIKKQKSRVMIEKLIDPSFIPDGVLAQLVRVPHVRD
ncbi:MAG: GIY-YIG nuclease family protein [Chitinophagaceae bacterium]|nr:GIY-YIG nuclease family protein [Chitinophagaceae bacterium]MCW5925539.1 GIY-YIG nuclease family protein [Chitinophagaceae bacterium]